MGATKILGYTDWNLVVKDADRQLEQIEATRKNMNLGEIIQKEIKLLAVRQRSKYPEPEPETMEDETKPEEKQEEETTESA